MAELNARIIAKASATTAEEPLAGDLEVAELAVNTADGKLFTKHTDGSIVTISGGGAVDSVNSQTGVVSLGIQDMDDFEATSSIPADQVVRYTYTNDATVSGGYDPKPNAWFLEFNETDADGNTGRLQALVDGWTPLVSPVYISADNGATWYQKTFRSQTNTAAGVQIEVDGWADPNSGDTYLTAATVWLGNYEGLPGGLPPAEGDILQWDNVDQKFKPAQLPDAIATRVLLGIGEYVDDAAAGTGGVASGAMYYNTTSSDYRLKS